jgi:hypothetical protein
MIIESLIRRPGGTVVALDAERYEFRPANGTEAHVCKVSNQEHIKQFLSVTEGFVEYANQSHTSTNDTADAGLNSGTAYESMTKAELITHIEASDISDGTKKLSNMTKKALIKLILSSDSSAE